MRFHQESCQEATLVPKLELQANGDGVPSPWCLRASEVISRLAWNRGMDFGRDKQGVLSLVQQVQCKIYKVLLSKYI
jgi:hypothetical protein